MKYARIDSKRKQPGLKYLLTRTKTLAEHSVEELEAELALLKQKQAKAKVAPTSILHNIRMVQEELLKRSQNA